MALDRQKMEEVVRPFATVADKIRALDAAGVPRAEIARFLGKRYQHVRNVLVDTPAAPPPRAGERTDFSGVEEAPSEPYRLNDEVSIVRLQISRDGTIRLPDSVMQALGVKPGGLIVSELTADSLVLLSLPESVRRVQALVRRIVPEGVSLVEGLLEDRRREFEAEMDD